MIVECSVLAIAATLFYVLSIRPTDLPSPEPASPTAHLDERKSTIHESLRDLQFDFRTGKLSETDYRASKLSLQNELAAVLLQLREAPASPGICCGACGKQFSRAMNFCGNCGKAFA